MSIKQDFQVYLRQYPDFDESPLLVIHVKAFNDEDAKKQAAKQIRKLANMQIASFTVDTKERAQARSRKALEDLTNALTGGRIV